MSARLFADDILFFQRLLRACNLYHHALDGIWGPHTDQAANAFETQSAALADSLGRFEQRSEQHISTLHLRTQALARQFLQTARAAGFEVRIISGTRTYAAQNQLFRQGRFGNPPPKVTNARGGQSNHNFGIAWDIGVFRGGTYRPESPDYNRIAELALATPELSGLDWGGNWQDFPDRPHYEIGTALAIGEVRRRFEVGENYLPAPPA